MFTIGRRNNIKIIELIIHIIIKIEGIRLELIIIVTI
jgi:hypothetical protein